ncbi:MAG: hypothetical protein GQ572_09805 [Gammaproteobacteria bacterium]|nr:hypothetical protein [Gammaproteobacteria bacterium]
MQEFVDVFNELKATSYRWGTPEWLKMRSELMDGDSKKSRPARKQRTLFKTMRGPGIEYLMYNNAIMRSVLKQEIE